MKEYVITPYIVTKEYEKTHGGDKLPSDFALRLDFNDMYLSLDEFSIKHGWMRDNKMDLKIEENHY